MATVHANTPTDSLRRIESLCLMSGIELPMVAVRAQVAEKYREHFRDEEPVVTEGLFSKDSGLVYPIVSDIPIMLIEEAMPASVLGR